jgi:hypothetical protein
MLCSPAPAAPPSTPPKLWSPHACHSHTYTTLLANIYQPSDICKQEPMRQASRLPNLDTPLCLPPNIRKPNTTIRGIERKEGGTHILINRTTGSQTIIGFSPFLGGSTLHLYCTSSFSGQSVRDIGGWRCFPFGRVLISASRLLGEMSGSGGDIALVALSIR